MALVDYNVNPSACGLEFISMNTIFEFLLFTAVILQQLNIQK